MPNSHTNVLLPPPIPGGKKSTKMEIIFLDNLINSPTFGDKNLEGDIFWESRQNLKIQDKTNIFKNWTIVEKMRILWWKVWFCRQVKEAQNFSSGGEIWGPSWSWLSSLVSFWHEPKFIFLRYWKSTETSHCYSKQSGPSQLIPELSFHSKSFRIKMVSNFYHKCPLLGHKASPRCTGIP